MYVRGDCRAGKTWEVYKRYQQPCKIVNGRVVKQKRRKREKPTKETVQRYNEKMKIRKLTRKINANFVTGDLYITLTYCREKRPDPQQAGGKSTYSCSRNLVEPPEKIKRVKAAGWRDEPAIPKGWALDKDSLTVGINPFTGFGYQFYRLVQIE